MEEKRRHNQNFMRRGGLVTVFFIITGALNAGKLIPLTGIVSEQGITVFAVGYELFLLLSLLFFYFAPSFVSKQISLRIGRGQYRNARAVFQISLSVCALIGCVLAVAFFFAADSYTSGFMQVPYATLAMKCLCVGLPLCGMVGVFDGYFEGMGTMMPTCVAGLLMQLVSLPVSLILGYRMSTYGGKAADLLMEPNIAAAYGSAAVSIAVVCGTAVSLLFLVAVYLIYQRPFRKNVNRDTTRNSEEPAALVSKLLSSMFPYACCAAILFADTWINQRLYVSSALKKEGIDRVLNDYGVFYGKYRPLILIAVVILTAACRFLTPVVSKLYVREAYHQLQLEFRDGIRKILIAGGSVSLVFTVLSSVVSRLLYKQNTQLAGKLLLIGGFAVLCYALAIYTAAFVNGLELPLLGAGAWLACLALQSVLAYVLLQVTAMGVTALAIMNVIYPLLVAGANFLIIRKKVL